MSTGQLAGKVAIVTGASRGIGAAIARRFAAEGARVALVARTLDRHPKLPGSLLETAQAIRSAGGEAVTIACDLANAQDRARIVPETVAAFGRLDILVNNAAWSRFVPIWEVQPKHVQLALEMNLIGPHELMQQALPHLQAAGAGWMLNISSATTDLPPVAPWDPAQRIVEYNQSHHPTVYGMSKAALDRLTAGWAIELGDKAIAVNVLAPVGAVASEGALEVGGWDERDHIEPMEAMVEAALQLCWRPASELSGRIARSLPLLRELGVPIRSLDGAEVLGQP